MPENPPKKPDTTSQKSTPLTEQEKRERLERLATHTMKSLAHLYRQREKQKDSDLKHAPTVSDKVM